jgi:hypothetical protein
MYVLLAKSVGRACSRPENRAQQSRRHAGTMILLQISRLGEEGDRGNDRPILDAHSYKTPVWWNDLRRTYSTVVGRVSQ